MRKKKIYNIIFLILLNLLQSNDAFPWDNEVTHRDLSEYAVANSDLSKNKGDHLKNYGFNSGLDEIFAWQGKNWSVTKWLREGAFLEDAGSKLQALLGKARFNNHFHNPLKPWDEAGLSDIQTGESSLKWAQDGSAQVNRVEGDWSWQKVREHFYIALTGRDFSGNIMASTQSQRKEYFARTFRGLGHQMHLIQDVSQPDHVRNDAHPEDELFGKNPLNGIAYFETWAKDNYIYINSLASNPVFPNVSLNISHNNLAPITQLVDTDRYDGLNASAGINQGLAEYANANFFSGDTIFAAERYSSDDKHYFPFPRKSSTDLQSYMSQIKPLLTQIAEDGIQDKGIWIKKERDGDAIDHFVRAGRWTGKIYKIFGEGSLFYDSFYRDETCYKDYASLLIPRAVGYSAGLLDYFFRGQLEVISAPGGIKVKNINTETMSSYTDSATGATVGSIEIYYDDKSDAEHLLASYQLASPLAPGQETPVITFATPPDNRAPGKYVVVFRGKLGNEEGVVIGKVIKAQIYYVSTSNDIDKIYKMGTDGSDLTVVYDNQDPNFFIGKIALSPDSKNLAFASETDVSDPMDATIYLIDLINNTRNFLTMGDWPNWSPDGKKIVFQRETGQYLPGSADVEIFAIDITTGVEIQLTNEAGSSYNGEPAWSPDGNTITYSKFNEPQIENCYNLYIIYLMDSSGNQIGPLTCQTDSPAEDFAPSWRSDGQEITFIRRNWGGQYFQLHKVDVSTQTITKLTDSTGRDYQEYPASWSNENAIALSSERDGDFDIWMVDSNGGGYQTNLTDSNQSFDVFPTFGW